MVVINVDDDADDDGDVDDDGDDDDNGDGEADNGGDEVDEDDDDDDDDDDGDGDGDGDGDAADDDDGDDDDDEEDDERKMMLLMLRRRKMMIMRRRRRRMLRRKTGPKTEKHTSCEPAQSKCRRTLHKSHLVWKITGHLRRHRFVRACAVEMLMDKVQQPFCMEMYRKNDRGHLRGIVLCEPAQWKCTWTCHKRIFFR